MTLQSKQLIQRAAICGALFFPGQAITLLFCDTILGMFVGLTLMFASPAYAYITRPK